MDQVIEFFKRLFDSSDWPPRWHCGRWTELHGWLYIISDLLIWSAYFTIPIVIIRYISKRQDIRFVRLYFLFAAFILACGATHLLDAVAFWVPAYRLNALFRLITGIISWITVFYLIKFLPVIFSLKPQRALEAEIEQRKRSEEKFRGLLEAAPDAMVIANDKGEIVLINKQTEKLFEYTKEELIGQPVEILIPASLHATHINERSSYFENPRVRSMGVGLELFALRKDGTQVPVEISLSPLTTEEGTLISASVRDITDRKKADAKLRKTEKDFQLLVSSVKDYAIFLLDKNGCVASWNSGAESIKGYIAEEIIGQPIDVFYTANEIALGEPKRNLQIALEKGHYETEGFRIRKDGSAFYANVVLTSLIDEGGKFYGYAKVTKDITEKRKTEERILFLASIADNIQDPVIASDENFYITRWNQAAEILLEWKSEEVIGKATGEILKTSYPDQTREQILNALDENEFWQGEVIYYTKSGRPVNIMETASKLKDAGGNITGNLVLARDITDRIKAEKQLKEFEHFFNNSHDLCGIANTVGYFEIINTNFSKVLGYSEKEFCEMPFIELIHPDDVASTLHEYGKLKSGAQTINFVNRYRKKDRNYLYLEWNATPNPITGKLYCVARDITDRKKVEDALSRLNEELEQRVKVRTEEVYKNEKRFKALIENNHDIISLMDEQFNVFYRSPSAARITGWTDDDVLNINGTKNIHPDDREKGAAIIKELMSKPGKTINTLFRNRHKDGHYIWVEGTVINLLQDEDVKAFVFNFRDVTARIEAEEKLTTERTLLRTLIDNLPDYIYVKDTRSRHLINNKANVAFLGVSTEEETIGKPVTDFVGNDMAISYLDDDQFVFRSGRSMINKEETIMSSTGEKKYLLTTKVPFRDGDNAIIGLVGISRDITLQKQIELDLIEKKYFLEKAQQVGQIGYWTSAVGSTGKLTWSAETCRIFGIEPGRFDGQLKTFFSFIHPEDLGMLNAASSFAVDNHLSYKIEHRIILRNGNTRWVYEQGEATYDENGTAVLIIGVVQDITERKEKEEKLIRNEELMRLAEANYRELFDKANDGIYVHEIETGRVINVNHRATELNGFSKEELLTGYPHNFISNHPDYTFEKALDYLQKAARGEPQFFEWLGRRKDDSSSWFEMNLKRANIGGQDRIIAFQRDINDRKKVEEKLKSSEKRFRALIENNYDMISMMDGSFKIIYRSPSSTRITGWTDEDLEADSTTKIHPDDLERSKNTLGEVLTSPGKAVKVSFRNQHKLGHYLWVEGSVINLLQDEDVKAIVFNFRDVTERIEGEEKIKHTLKEKNLILESIGDAFFAVDKNWVVTYWNRIAETALNVPKHAIVSKNLWDIFSDSIHSFSYKKYHQAMTTNQVVHFEDYHGALNKWYEISAYPSENGLSVYFKDITERKKARELILELNTRLEEKINRRTEELQVANRELEAFTYSVSHDLRAPLRGIIGFTAILEEEYSSQLDDEARRITSVIKSNTLKMGNLIDDLLNFSRMGRKEIEKTKIDADEMVQQIVADIDKQKPGGSIEWDIHPLLAFTGDFNTIRQVWINLISNAVKYSSGKEKPRIEIGSYPEDNQLIFFIKDNGAGFDPRYKEKLFKVFQRLHGSDEFEGTGVGLAIVEKIISKHGGKVWAEGEVDKGASFYFSLPASL